MNNCVLYEQNRFSRSLSQAVGSCRKRLFVVVTEPRQGAVISLELMLKPKYHSLPDPEFRSVALWVTMAVCSTLPTVCLRPSLVQTVRLSVWLVTRSGHAVFLISKTPSQLLHVSRLTALCWSSFVLMELTAKERPNVAPSSPAGYTNFSGHA